jgi:hypothetical protein
LKVHGSSGAGVVMIMRKRHTRANMTNSGTNGRAATNAAINDLVSVYMPNLLHVRVCCIFGMRFAWRSSAHNAHYG